MPDPIVTPDPTAIVTPAPAPTPESGGTVTRAEFERVMNELHGHKKTAKELKEAADKAETERLKAQDQWKELAERHEKAANEWKEKYTGLTGTIVKDKKLSAVREEALKNGIRQEALSDLDMLELREVQVETTSTGRINVSGANAAIANLKALKPHWFGGAASPGVNVTTPGVVNAPTGTISIADLRKAEVEGKKSGDSTTYYKLVKQYQEQNRKRA